MRKIGSFVLLVLMFVLLSVMVVYAEDRANVSINGEILSFEGQGAVIIDGRTLVPVRAVFEALGFNVGWEPTTQTATITRGGDTIVMTIGSNIFTTNGHSRTLGVAAQIIGGATLVPIRLPLESVGYQVEWNAATRTVLITAGARAAGVDDPREFERQVFELVNAERAAHGLPALAWNEDLVDVVRWRIDGGGIILPENLAITHQRIGARAAIFSETPQSIFSRSMDTDDHRAQILAANVVSLGIIQSVTHFVATSGSEWYAFHLAMLFATPTEIPRVANPLEFENAVRLGIIPISEITLQNRQQTPAERAAWIAEYQAMGGPSAFERAVLDEVNRVRLGYGLNALAWCNDLGMASRFYAQMLADLDYDVRTHGGANTLAHRYGPYGGSNGVAQSFGVNNRRGANGGWAPRDIEGVVQMWMNSPGHRNNVLRANTTAAGFGAVVAGENQFGAVYYFMLR